MRQNVARVIQDLSEITASDLDTASVEELCQLQFWLAKHQGSIFVKTVGRLTQKLESMTCSKP